MTAATTDAPPPAATDGAATGAGAADEATVPPEAPWWQAPLAAVTPRWVAAAMAVWLVVTLLGVVLVAYGVGPMLQRREQSRLLADYRTEIRQAAAEEVSFDPDAGPDLDAPAPGSPVAVLEIGAIELLQVVVEGVGPQQTRRAPGHVPGTAGPGQPGNSGIVARRTAFGGPFGDLSQLARGDEILVTTTQGQSIYRVRTVATGRDLPGDAFGPTADEDRLTLVTSASSQPWSGDDAVVVVAELEGRPFEPTPQAGRRPDADGRAGDGDGAAPLTLAGLAYLVTIATSLALYRTNRPRSAYLLTAPPLLATVVLVAESAARLLPAWT
jgi:sortase A